MEYGTELARLEEFVDKLLNKYNKLKAEYQALQDALHQRDTECADLQKKVLALSAERTEVGSKVSGLLDRIEQWESDQLSPSDSRNVSTTAVQGGALHAPEVKTY